MKSSGRERRDLFQEASYQFLWSWGPKYNSCELSFYRTDKYYKVKWIIFKIYIFA